MLVQTTDEAERWLKAEVKIIPYSSDLGVLGNGYAAAVRRLRPDG